MAKKQRSAQPGQIYIGTSNVVVPGNKQTFPAEFQSTSRLHYYSHLFNSVEINSSFYKTPLKSTFDKWQADVPDGFRFSVKLSKAFTHVKDLKSDLAEVSGFLEAADGLGPKKGKLLIQFPGKISLEYFNQVESLLEAVSASPWKAGWAVGVEFRHPSWYVGETTELLDEFEAALVLQDIPKSRWSEVVTASSNIYLRFHGPTGNYRDSYSDQFLQERAAEFIQWRDQGKTVYVYFNNTIGEAFNNARYVKSLVEVAELPHG